jgi:thioredoxin 2
MPAPLQSRLAAPSYTYGVSETNVVACPNCGQNTRVRAAAEGVPHCPKCGKPLPWLTESATADFAAVVERSPIPVLVDFWAPWCAPCRIVAPTVESLSRELAGRLKAVKVNTDQDPALQERFGVRGIPTLVLLEGGKERDRVTGALPPDALRRWVAERLPARTTSR